MFGAWVTGVLTPLSTRCHGGFRAVLTYACIYDYLSSRPQIRRDYPLNLSILISGGKENKRDSPSNGERKGKSSAPSPVGILPYGRCGVHVAVHRHWKLQQVPLTRAFSIVGARPIAVGVRCRILLRCRVKLLESAI